MKTLFLQTALLLFFTLLSIGMQAQTNSDEKNKQQNIIVTMVDGEVFTGEMKTETDSIMVLETKNGIFTIIK
jgi:hypothetical protein